jgi:hypothetical protein
MNAKLNDKTVMRISQILNQPISRGIDKAINSCLDKIVKPKGVQRNGGENQK